MTHAVDRGIQLGPIARQPFVYPHATAARGERREIAGLDLVCNKPAQHRQNGGEIGSVRPAVIDQ